MKAQALNLARVTDCIGRTVYDFWLSHDEFHMSELAAFVRERHPSAPDSAGRILRNMRQRGILNYEVIDRRNSRYRNLPLCNKEMKNVAING